MTPFYAFLQTLRTRPMTALGALYWYVTGRKMRARNRLHLGTAGAPDAYARWINTIERNEDAIAMAPSRMANWSKRPRIAVVAHALDQDAEETRELLSAMMQAQIYPEWELIIATRHDAIGTGDPRIRQVEVPAASDRAALEVASTVASGDYLLPLPPSARLPPTALYRYAEALQLHPDAAMLFGDEDRIAPHGDRHDPWFKAEWNAEMALAQDYASGALLLSLEHVRWALSVGGGCPDGTAYELALTIAHRSPDRVHHVAHILAHGTGRQIDVETRRGIVRGHLAACGDERAVVGIGAHDTLRVDWPMPNPPPLVSILIPTHDRVDLLRSCITSLRAATSYPRYEIIVIDNGSLQRSTLRYLDHLSSHDNIRILRDDRPYNFSALNNAAAYIAYGDYLCLLNNDTEIIESGWLEAMVRQAIRPHVGAVGAKLLYEDRTIQHAGVALGLNGVAGHPHRFQRSEDIGDHARTHVAHRVSAVTAACLVVEKRKYLAVGGLNEDRFAIAFNDVDFCLKLDARGWHNIYTPSAVLIHKESKSRGRDVSPTHVERYRRESRALQDSWGTADHLDPLHHRYLDRSSEQRIIRL